MSEVRRRRLILFGMGVFCWALVAAAIALVFTLASLESRPEFYVAATTSTIAMIGVLIAATVDFWMRAK